MRVTVEGGRERGAPAPRSLTLDWRLPPPSQPHPAPPPPFSPPVIQAAAALPNYGIGASFRRTSWPPSGCHWTVTRVAPAADGVHGKAWGVLVWKGVAAKGAGGVPVRVRGALKPVWAQVVEAAEAGEAGA